jgi:hypothetical protein
MHSRTLLTILLIGVAATAFPGGSSEDIVATSPSSTGVPATITVTAGEHYSHRMNVMPLISVKNHPQMAAWVETEDGEFLATLFITKRLGTQDWRGAPADPTPAKEIRRVEALPVWSHRHGKRYADELPVPTREEPMPDAVTSATPSQSFSLRTVLPEEPRTIRVYFEVNNSTDFNETYAQDAEPGDAGYSGGEFGSGQPSLVYRASVDTGRFSEGSAPTVRLELVGHGSPDGSTGEIYQDLDGITTARSILRSVTVSARAGSGKDSA